MPLQCLGLPCVHQGLAGGLGLCREPSVTPPALERGLRSQQRLLVKLTVCPSLHHQNSKSFLLQENNNSGACSEVERGAARAGGAGLSSEGQAGRAPPTAGMSQAGPARAPGGGTGVRARLEKSAWTPDLCSASFRSPA